MGYSFISIPRRTGDGFREAPFVIAWVMAAVDVAGHRLFRFGSTQILYYLLVVRKH